MDRPQPGAAAGGITVQMDPEFPPLCPSCGYDLSAIVASWPTLAVPACPISGTCSECGGGLEWRRVMDPATWGPWWSLEHAERATLWRWLAATLVSAAPGVLWRGLKPGRGIRLGRLWLLALSWVVIVHVALTGVAGVWRSPLSFPATTWLDHLPWWIFPYGERFEVGLAVPGTARVLSASTGAVLAYVPAAAIPMWIVVLGLVFPGLRLPRRDVLRAALLSVPMAALACGLILAGDAACVRLGVRLAGTTGDPPLMVDALLALVILWYPVFLCFWWREALSAYFGVRRAGWLASLLGVLVVATVVGLVSLYGWLAT